VKQERFRMLVEGVKDYAIFMLDRQGLVTSWNAGAEWMRWASGFSIRQSGDGARCFRCRL